MKHALFLNMWSCLPQHHPMKLSRCCLEHSPVKSPTEVIFLLDNHMHNNSILHVEYSNTVFFYYFACQVHDYLTSLLCHAIYCMPSYIVAAFSHFLLHSGHHYSNNKNNSKKVYILNIRKYESNCFQFRWSVLRWTFICCFWMQMFCTDNQL